MDMGKGIWAIFAGLMGIWTAFHLFMMLLIYSHLQEGMLFADIEMGVVAIVFTLSLIATLFFAEKYSECAEEEDKERIRAVYEKQS